MPQFNTACAFGTGKRIRTRTPPSQNPPGRGGCESEPRRPSPFPPARVWTACIRTCPRAFSQHAPRGARIRRGTELCGSGIAAATRGVHVLPGCATERRILGSHHTEKNQCAAKNSPMSHPWEMLGEFIRSAIPRPTPTSPIPLVPWPCAPGCGLPCVHYTALHR